jgi:hypothetical protein
MAYSIKIIKPYVLISSLFLLGAFDTSETVPYFKWVIHSSKGSDLFITFTFHLLKFYIKYNKITQSILL